MKSPFKLRSGNKPSIAKLSGVSPLKDDKFKYGFDVDEAMKSEGFKHFLENPKEYEILSQEVKADTKWRNERNRRLDILDKDYPEIVSQKGSPGPDYKKIKGTNIYKHPLGMKKDRDKRNPNLKYTFFGDTEKNKFDYTGVNDKWAD